MVNKWGDYKWYGENIRRLCLTKQKNSILEDIYPYYHKNRTSYLQSARKKLHNEKYLFLKLKQTWKLPSFF